MVHKVTLQLHRESKSFSEPITLTDGRYLFKTIMGHVIVELDGHSLLMLDCNRLNELIVARLLDELLVNLRVNTASILRL